MSRVFHNGRQQQQLPYIPTKPTTIVNQPTWVDFAKDTIQIESVVCLIATN